MDAQKRLDRISSLERRHKELDRDIERGYSNYIDDSHLSKMKSEKLYIKDQLEKLKNEA